MFVFCVDMEGKLIIGLEFVVRFELLGESGIGLEEMRVIERRYLIDKCGVG